MRGLRLLAGVGLVAGASFVTDAAAAPVEGDSCGFYKEDGICYQCLYICPDEPSEILPWSFSLQPKRQRDVMTVQGKVPLRQQDEWKATFDLVYNGPDLDGDYCKIEDAPSESLEVILNLRYRAASNQSDKLSILFTSSLGGGATASLTPSTTGAGAYTERSLNLGSIGLDESFSFDTVVRSIDALNAATTSQFELILSASLRGKDEGDVKLYYLEEREFEVACVPLPPSLALMASGFGFLTVMRRWRRDQASLAG